MIASHPIHMPNPSYPIDVIPYIFPPMHTSIYWTTAIDVLIYLLDKPDERQAILEEIHQ